MAPATVLVATAQLLVGVAMVLFESGPALKALGVARSGRRETCGTVRQGFDHEGHNSVSCDRDCTPNRVRRAVQRLGTNEFFKPPAWTHAV